MPSPRAWSSLVFPLWLLGCSGSHIVRHCDTGDPETGRDAGELEDGAVASDAGRLDGAVDAGTRGDGDSDAAPPQRACESGQACQLRHLFRYERPAALSGVSFIDANGDGRSDVLSSYGDSRVTYLELMHEDGSLAPAVTIPTGSVTAHAVGDFDADGNTDFAVIGQTKLSIFRGDGQAHFTSVFEHTFANPLLAISMGKADGDATDDLVLVTGANGRDFPVSMFIARFTGATPSFGNEVSLPALKDGGLALFAREGKSYVIAGTQAAVWPVASDGTIGAAVPLPSPEGIFGAGVAQLDRDDYLDIYALLDPVDGKARLGVWFADKDGFVQAPTIVETPQSAWPHLISVGSPPQDQLALHFDDGFHRLGFSDRTTFEILPTLGDLPAWSDDAIVLSTSLGGSDSALLVASRIGKMLVRMENPMRTLHADLAQPAALVQQDFTGDGRLDLVATTPSTGGELALFENNPVTGLAAPRTVRVLGDAQPPFITPASIDSDGDGRPELVTGSAWGVQNADLAQIVPAAADAALGKRVVFGYSTFYRPLAIDGFDLDADGVSDVIEQFSEELVFWPASKLGREPPLVSYIDWPGPNGVVRRLTGTSAVMTDLDGDGARELLVPRNSAVWHLEYDAAKQQLGDAKTWATQCGIVLGLSLLDVDEDQRPDLLLHGRCGQDQTLGLYWFRADGKALEQQAHALDLGGSWMAATAHADLDGDGRDELIALDNLQTLHTYRNLGKGHFEAAETLKLAVEQLLSPPAAVQLLVGDYTGDGQAELVVHFTGDNGPDAVLVLQNHVVD